MKYVKNIFMLALLITFLYPFNFATAATTKEVLYTPQIGNAIQQNCASLKNTLTDLRKRDISSRVARVYIYDFLTVRTDAFVLRLSKHKLDNTKVKVSNNALKVSLDQFKSDYGNYDEDITKLTATDCSNPVEFYQNLQATKKSRQKLASDIKEVNNYWKQLKLSISSVNLKNSQDNEGDR